MKHFDVFDCCACVCVGRETVMPQEIEGYCWKSLLVNNRDYLSSVLRQEVHTVYHSFLKCVHSSTFTIAVTEGLTDLELGE